MHVDRDVYIPMRDGTRLCADIYLPKAGGSHAAILWRTPYLKSGQMTGDFLNSEGRPMEIPLLRRPVANGAFPVMLASLGPLLDAGYAVVVSDVRGTGFSEGVYDYYNIESGLTDGFDTVEWIAEQPWCDGNVGMSGASASAIYCYQAALTRPPHLKAMFANMHPVDYYHDQWFVGGVFRWENRIGWCTGMQARLAPQAPGKPTDPNYETKRQVYEDRYHQYYDRIRRGQNAFNADWLTELYQHATYDDFWRERSYAPRLAEIDIPTLHGGVWYDHFIRGTLAGHAGISGPSRLIVGPGWHGAPEEAGDGDIDRLHVRWYDRFLRGAEDGLMDEPNARLYLYGDERWVDEPAWPVPATERELFLAPGPGGGADSTYDGLLCPEPAAGGTSAVLCHDPAAPNRTPLSSADQRSFEARALTFSTPPLEADLEVIGSPRLVLHASSDALDADFCVRLCDVYPDGRSRLLNFGALKASHAASHETPQTLERDRTYELEVEIWAIGAVFKRGHRLRIDISNSDFPFFESNSIPSANTVHMGSGTPSRLILPVVER